MNAGSRTAGGFLVLFTTVSASSSIASSSIWGTLGKDAQRTGRSINSGPTAPPALFWSYTAGESLYSSPAIAADGTVFFGSFDTHMYALNGTSGAQRWNYTTGSLVSASPTISPVNGAIVFGSGDSYVYCLDQTTGGLIWRAATSGVIASSSPVIDALGNIYVGSNDYYLYCFASNGTLRWRFQTTYIVSSSPALDPSEGVIYICSGISTTKYVYALISSTGAQLWRYHLPSSADENGGSVSVANGVVFAPGHSFLWALNAASGSVPWQYASGASSPANSPSIGADGNTLYVGALDSLRAVSASTGIELWRYETGGDVEWCTPAIGGDGSVYGAWYGPAAGGQTMYAVNGTTGALLWTLASGDDGLVSSPAIGANGAVYFTSTGGTIYAFGPQPPPAPAAPPAPLQPWQIGVISAGVIAFVWMGGALAMVAWQRYTANDANGFQWNPSLSGSGSSSQFIDAAGFDTSGGKA